MAGLQSAKMASWRSLGRFVSSGTYTMAQLAVSPAWRRPCRQKAGKVPLCVTLWLASPSSNDRSYQADPLIERSPYVMESLRTPVMAADYLHVDLDNVIHSSLKECPASPMCCEIPFQQRVPFCTVSCVRHGVLVKRLLRCLKTERIKQRDIGAHDDFGRVPVVQDSSGRSPARSHEPVCRLVDAKAEIKRALSITNSFNRQTAFVAEA